MTTDPDSTRRPRRAVSAQGWGAAFAGMQRCKDLVGAWSGIAYRSVAPEYAAAGDVISGMGSQKFGGRWNPAGRCRAVYASLDAETAMREALAHFRHYHIPEHAAMPRVFVGIDVKLSRALDLRVAEARTRLRVSIERMIGHDWRAAQGVSSHEPGDTTPVESLTQSLGWAAFKSGIEGLLVPAASGEPGSNVVVFPDNLRTTSVLRVRAAGAR